MTHLRLAGFAALALPALALAGEPSWKKHDINPKSIFECAGAWDVDNDGKVDIVSGDTWYRAPDWTPYPVRKVSQAGTYMNDFSNIPLDVNGDGHVDFVTTAYFTKNVGWVENPGKAGAAWTYHEVDTPGNIEATVRVDLDGDGVGDILPNSTNVVVWYGVEKDGKGHTLKKHDFSSVKGSAGHGVGTGDVNGDGRLDILTPNGWFEAPTNPKSSEVWAWHPDWKLPATGIQILGRDLDGDGVMDVVYGMGHGIGLFWKKGEKSADGKVTLGKEMLIDKEVSSVHTLLWADLDGDGKADELISGKRVYAHEREPGDIDSPIVAYYTFDPARKGWDRHLIAKGEPAKDAPADPGKRNAQKDFLPGTAGTGLEIAAIDIDGDGDLDLVCPGKSGLYLFENLLKSK